jgi:hypothetical protein
VPWNGSGTYTRGYASWGNDANSGLPISSTKFDLEDNDFAAGIQNCLTIDGQNIPNATLNWKQQLNLTRATDGNITLWGRTGGSNNPALTFSVADATGVAFTLSTAQQISFATGGSTRLTISGTGTVNIPVPTSGFALTVNGHANSPAAVFQGSGTSGQSIGATVLAGTTSADVAFNVFNSSGGTEYFQVRGDGLTQAIDQGGTLQDVGWRGTPTNTQSSNYTLQLSDRGKTVVLNGSTGQTLTVPNGIFSAGDVVSVLVSNGTNTYTIVQGTGVNLYWAGNGVTSGNRTLSSIGLATIIFQLSNTAIISGAGLS